MEPCADRRPPEIRSGALIGVDEKWLDDNLRKAVGGEKERERERERERDVNDGDKWRGMDKLPCTQLRRTDRGWQGLRRG